MCKIRPFQFDIKRYSMRIKKGKGQNKWGRKGVKPTNLIYRNLTLTSHYNSSYPFFLPLLLLFTKKKKRVKDKKKKKKK